MKAVRGDYRLAFRHEYYANTRTGSPEKDSYNPVDFFHAAMQRGYPDSSQIALKVRVAPPQSEAKGPAGGETDTSKAATSRYDIDIAAAVASVQTQQTPDETRHAELVIAAVVYGALGKVLASEARHLSLAFSPGDYAHVLQSGLPFHLPLNVPPGVECIRVGVFDPVSRNVGTVEIPSVP